MQIIHLSADKSLLQVAMSCLHCNHATCITNFGTRLKLFQRTNADLQLLLPSIEKGRF